MNAYDVMTLLALGSLALSCYLTFYYFPKHDKKDQ